MKILKRILRLSFYTLLIVLAAAIGALVVLTKTERGRENLAGIISNMASSGDSKVTVSGIDGIWSGALTVDHVVLEDREGAWLVARKVAVDWSPLALLSKNFSADRIAAERIELARLPVASTEPAKSGSGGLPVSLDIRAIDLPQIALGLSFGIFLMTTFFREVPKDLIDAARLDGCTDLQLLKNVMIPIGLPAINALAVIEFMWTWNSFFFPLVIATKQELMPLSVSIIDFMGRFTFNYELVATTCVINHAPTRYRPAMRITFRRFNSASSGMLPPVASSRVYPSGDGH